MALDLDDARAASFRMFGSCCSLARCRFIRSRYSSFVAAEVTIAKGNDSCAQRGISALSTGMLTGGAVYLHWFLDAVDSPGIFGTK